MFKTTLEQLESGTRDELQRLLANPSDAFSPDFEVFAGFAGLALLGCVGGIGVAIWDLSDGYVLREIVEYPQTALYSLSVGGLLLGVPLALWLAIFLIRGRGRFGYAALSNAIIVVRGSDLKVHPFAEIVGVETRTIGRSGNRFTVVTLVYASGEKHELNVTGRWARAAIEAFERRT